MKILPSPATEATTTLGPIPGQIRLSLSGRRDLQDLFFMVFPA